MSRKRVGGKFGTMIVQCDWLYDNRYPGEGKRCIEEFRSASVDSVIPTQLDNAGWKSRTIRPGTGESTRQDLCPMHAERVGLAPQRMPERRTY